jgi:hypothetical protein
MSHFKKELSNLPDIQIWINKVFHDLNTHNFDDFISYGNYLYLIKYIEETYLVKLDESLLISTSAYENYLKKLLRLYEKEKSSIEKYDTALKLNKIFKKSLFKVNRSEITDYLSSIQLENGSFPLYGEGLNSDTLTTYLAVQICNELEIDIANREKLFNFLLYEKKKSYSNINEN